MGRQGKVRSLSGHSTGSVFEKSLLHRENSENRPKILWGGAVFVTEI
jgi:hypothetical protein